ncbi:MAG: radical SAM protein [Candidatus Omnitrophota bacterium]
MRKILLVNPWIYDFAAYDLWIKPWGLLKISAILKKNGFSVSFVDATDRHHPLLDKPVKDFPDGTGKFLDEEVEKPEALKDIPRRFKRYGLPVDIFTKTLPQEDVDLILVSSGMTYWYPGAFEAIRILRERYNTAKIVLGGTYATLARDHAIVNSGADYVIPNKDLSQLSSVLGKECDFSFKNILDEAIDYDWYENPGYAVLRISLGCPFDCAYCAQKKLGPGFILKDEEKAINEIESLYEKGIKNFAFYDDALLFKRDYLKRYLRRIGPKGIKAGFYTPNGLHARFIDMETADLMKKVGFINPILSLEIASDEKGRTWHDKVTMKELEYAVTCLRKAGYKDGEHMVYLMLGVPGSDAKDTMESIDRVHSLGAKISLSEFSPVSGTKLASSFTEAHKEPLYQNNSAFPSFDISEWDEIKAIKAYARKLNSLVLSGRKNHQ